jgi:tryptophan 6-halogenase
MTKQFKVCVLGGGTAGQIIALILKTRFNENIQIDIIKSDKVGIVGVGEGSTEHWKEFTNFVGIDPYELISKTDATLKAAIMFDGWGNKKYIHNTTYSFSSIKFGQLHAAYLAMIKDKQPFEKLVNPLNYKSKIKSIYLPENNFNQLLPTNQFHFNAAKLNSFLEEVCIKKQINCLTDEIVDVTLNNKGEIDSLKSLNKVYKNYNLYIDCTGFKKVLISKLGAKWISYDKYLHTNEAIAFPTEDTKEYPLYTLSKTLKYGWMWRIPTYGRWGNGYVYNNNYINAEQAQIEVEKILGHKVNIFKNIKFNPGCLDKVWIKNCLALGLSSIFIEPLEASSIASIIQQSFLLMHQLPIYNETTIKQYNTKMEAINKNIRDFICLHFCVKKQDSAFWKSVQNVALPDTLKNQLELWQNRLPIDEDFADSKYLIYTPHNFILTLYGLDILNISNLKKHYNFLSKKIKNEIEIEVDNLQKQYRIKQTTVGHKDLLTKIRKHYEIRS